MIDGVVVPPTPTSDPKRRLSISISYPIVIVVCLALYCGIEISTYRDLGIASNKSTKSAEETTSAHQPSPSTSFRTPSTRPPPCPDYSSTNVTTILLAPKDHRQKLGARLASLPNGTTEELFSSCQPTCQVRLIPKCPYWELETVDCHNNTKTVGGDEFYLTYSDHALASDAEKAQDGFWTRPASAVAFWVDQNNGRYQIDFQAPPMSLQPSNSSPVSQHGGVFAVYLHYTCGIGRMAYPLKKSWPHGGQTVGWARSTEALSIAPPIRPFELPTEDRLNLFQFSNIIPVGDSLLKFFLQPLGITFPNINRPLNQTTLQDWKDAIEAQMNFKDLSKSVLIAGSCAWDLFEYQNVSTTTWRIDIDGGGGDDDDDGKTRTSNSNSNSSTQLEQWQDHRESLTNLLTHIQGTYPNLTVVWKSCAGFHIHVPFLYNKHKPADRAVMEARLKHMSTSRAISIHKVQADVLQQAKRNHPGKVFFIDVYPAYYLSADLTRAGDGRHYQDALDIRISNWFVNETIVEKLWRQRQPRPPTSALIVSNYHERGWVEWVNAALLAKATGRRLVWERETSSHVNSTTATQSDGGDLSPQLLKKTDLFKDNYIKRNAYAQKFVSSLFDFSVSGSEHLYGMIFHRILVELSGDQESGSSFTPPPLKKGHTVAIAPFSGPPNPANVNQCLQAHLSTVFATETPAVGDCVVLVPSQKWSLSITPATLERHNCTVHVLPSSFYHPYQTLLVATQLAESYDSSSLLLSCSIPASKLLLQLLDYLLQARARRLGRLPFLGEFSHVCLP